MSDSNRNVIPLETAIKRTTAWRAFIKDKGPWKTEADLPRGSYIPVQDILDLVHDYRHRGIEMEGVRAYFTCALPDGTDNTEKCMEISLIFVPVDKDNKDILEIPTIGKEGLKGTESGVEDFTKPCPSVCDVDSPLYGKS